MEVLGGNMPDNNKRAQKDILIDDERLVHDKDEENIDDDLAAFYQEKEKADKEVQRELKKRVNSVDKDINGAKTPRPEARDGKGKTASINGYNKPVVKIGEKLILPEPDDMLNEAEIRRYESSLKSIRESLISFYNRATDDISDQELAKLYDIYDRSTDNIDRVTSKINRLLK